MKTPWVVGIVCAVLLAQSVQAQMYQTVGVEEAQILQDGPGAEYCPNCGMHLVKFYRTGHALAQPDGHTHQYCSLHCLVEGNPGSLDQALVVDQSTLQFVPAASATYVVGSAKPGTMTMKSKYAFADAAAARTFAVENGGEVVDFATAVTIARAGLDLENKNIDAKRAKMAAKGQKIYQTFLADVELPTFPSIAEAKTHVSGLGVAAHLDDAQLQAVALYLVRRDDLAAPATGPALVVPERAKCPVCGMFVAKYPQWAAALAVDSGPTYYFDGVKDLMKFLFDPEAYKVDRKIMAKGLVQVTDYYTLGSLDGHLAFYVVGSNVYGPMGNELIPFASRADAETFLKDHAGDRAVTFDQITPALVRKLNE